ncbi:protein-ADP-ribose hydrolase [Streptacidiphilus rugosus]|uniref:protein-ADP-ribose hydrolase n=1 Tax=Streptacidiphilus rugosus TaxID=405783 RepID=UPI00055B589E|nr:protein-ADP-ribose hydrolase [Streptacidiphilus rugosus]
MDTRALPLAAYRSAVSLDEPYRPAAAPAAAGEPSDLARRALRLLAQDPAVARAGLRPEDADERGTARALPLLRAVLTIREPGPLPAQTVEILDALLTGERQHRQITKAVKLPSIAAQFPETPYRAAGQTALWRGDITGLAADAVVNAANRALLGCFVPEHPCIDNALHSAAGPALREDCHTIMALQGHDEPTGTAKITRGYHLPAAYVLHTVGPIVNGLPGPDHEVQLSACYRACLELAAEIDTIRTVAFCAISTGMFGYPKPAAARLALQTVADWLETHPGRLDRVVFNVYGDDDHAAYVRALSEGDPAP